MSIIFFVLGFVLSVAAYSVFYFWGYTRGLKRAGHYDYNLHYGCKECREWDILQYELRQWDRADSFRYARPFYDPNLFKNSMEKAEYEKRVLGKFSFSESLKKPGRDDGFWKARLRSAIRHPHFEYRGFKIYPSYKTNVLVPFKINNKEDAIYLKSVEDAHNYIDDLLKKEPSAGTWDFN